MLDFNLRPLSWSSMEGFNWNKEQWYKKYILNEEQPSNAGMDFGKEIGQKIANDPKFLPMLPRYDTFEKKLEATIGDIRIVGYLDSFDSKRKFFIEYKTSSNTAKWNQKSADEHGQILMYLFLIWKNYGIPPEKVEVKLVYIPVSEHNDFSMKLTEGAEIQVFEVRHTVLDVLNFATKIKQTVEDMRKFVKSKQLTVNTG